MKILTDPTIDDSVKVTVTVGEMRAALWYYNNFWIQKEANIEKSNIISGYMELSDTQQATIKQLKQDEWYVLGFWGVSGALLTIIGLEVAGVL